MATPFLINIVVALSYYSICAFVFLYLFIIECIQFVNSNIITILVFFNIFMFFYLMNLRYEQYVLINTCRQMSKEMFELNIKNNVIKSQHENLMIEYTNNTNKKDIKIDHLYKKCKQCNEIKNITFFNKNLNSKDNFTNYCKDCNVSY